MDPVAELQRTQGNLIRLGTIAEVDLIAALCRVYTGEIYTTFVPWFVPRAGDTVEWSAPAVGEQVVLLCPGGDTNAALILRGIYSDAHLPPASAASMHLVRYADGAEIAYDDATHACTVTLPAGGTVRVVADGGVSVIGSATASDNLAAGTGASGSFTTPTGQTVLVQDGIVTNIF